MPARGCRAGPAGRAFRGPVKAAVTAQIVAGVALAISAVGLSIIHHLSGQIPVFAVVALLLAVDAVLVWRALPWAVMVNLIAFAGQAVAVVGLIIELTVGISTVKAHRLRQLGVDPTVGVIINLVYSGIGLAIFCWYTARWRKACRAQRQGGQYPDGSSR